MQYIWCWQYFQFENKYNKCAQCIKNKQYWNISISPAIVIIDFRRLHMKMVTSFFLTIILTKFENQLVNFNARYLVKLLRQEPIYSIQTNIHSIQTNIYSKQTNIYSIQTNIYSIQTNIYSKQKPKKILCFKQFWSFGKST